MANKRLAVIDCGQFPSEDNCKIKISAPEEQVEKVIDVACEHACKKHGHQDSPELRKALREAVQYEEQ